MAVDQIVRLDAMTGAGGNLHAVLDDWNVDDENVVAARAIINRVRTGKPERYDDTHPPQLEIEAAVLDALEPMSVTERATVLAIRDGYVIL